MNCTITPHAQFASSLNSTILSLRSFSIAPEVDQRTNDHILKFSCWNPHCTVLILSSCSSWIPLNSFVVPQVKHESKTLDALAFFNNRVFKHWRLTGCCNSQEKSLLHMRTRRLDRVRFGEAVKRTKSKPVTRKCKVFWLQSSCSSPNITECCDGHT